MQDSIRSYLLISETDIFQDCLNITLDAIERKIADESLNDLSLTTSKVSLEEEQWTKNGATEQSRA